MKNTCALFALIFAVCLTASADFSYTNTQKVTGGSMGAMAGTAGNRTDKYYFKGDKMMNSNGDSSTIIDFGAQTITTINNAAKTYTVKKFSDVAAAANVNADMAVDIKETGQKKMVNGFNASETLVTMNMDVEMGRGAPTMKLAVELDMWVSPDVPGAGELRAFYQKNAANFPWSAVMGDSGNQSLQKAMAQMQKALSKMNGVVVEQVIRIKPTGGAQAPQMAQMPQMTPDQQAKMQAAMAQMQQMAKQGGPGAAAAQQAMAAMGGMNGMAMGGGAAANSSSLMEMTVEGSGFSTASVPDSVFAIPASYTQK